tara:strand:- start:11590 stop:12057 length:468 start_codon:yes stop_codon:yes gene_type:complete
MPVAKTTGKQKGKKNRKKPRIKKEIDTSDGLYGIVSTFHGSTVDVDVLDLNRTVRCVMRKTTDKRLVRNMGSSLNKNVWAMVQQYDAHWKTGEVLFFCQEADVPEDIRNVLVKPEAGDITFSQDATEADFGGTVDDQEKKVIVDDDDCNFNFDDI